MVQKLSGMFIWHVDASILNRYLLLLLLQIVDNGSSLTEIGNQCAI